MSSPLFLLSMKAALCTGGQCGDVVVERFNVCDRLRISFWRIDPNRQIMAKVVDTWRPRFYGLEKITT